MNEIQSSAMRYAQAKRVIELLRRHRADITDQEYRTLKGQALAGDTSGAEKGLQKILTRKGLLM